MARETSLKVLFDRARALDITITGRTLTQIHHDIAQAEKARQEHRTLHKCIEVKDANGLTIALTRLNTTIVQFERYLLRTGIPDGSYYVYYDGNFHTHFTVKDGKRW